MKHRQILSQSAAEEFVLDIDHAQLDDPGNQNHIRYKEDVLENRTQGENRNHRNECEKWIVRAVLLDVRFVLLIGRQRAFFGNDARALSGDFSEQFGFLAGRGVSKLPLKLPNACRQRPAVLFRKCDLAFKRILKRFSSEYNLDKWVERADIGPPQGTDRQ